MVGGRRGRRNSSGEIIYVVTCYIFSVGVAIAAIYPFIYVLSASFSSGNSILTGRLVLWPVDFNIRAYEKLLVDKRLWMSYLNTLYIAGGGTLFSVLMTSFAAYPLSKSRLKGRGIMLFIIAFTMFFGGGMIPTYMVFRWFNLINHRTTLIVAFAINSFFVMILMMFFKNISPEMEESAQIEGANDLLILFRIVMPLSRPVLLTLALYYIVGKWNAFFWEMMLLRDEWKRPLQIYLREILIKSQFSPELMELTGGTGITLLPENIKYAAIIVAIIPIISFYPSIQKYFSKGIMLGSIK